MRYHCANGANLVFLLPWLNELTTLQTCTLHSLWTVHFPFFGQKREPLIWVFEKGGGTLHNAPRAPYTTCKPYNVARAHMGPQFQFHLPPKRAFDVPMLRIAWDEQNKHPPECPSNKKMFPPTPARYKLKGQTIARRRQLHPFRVALKTKEMHT